MRILGTRSDLMQIDLKRSINVPGSLFLWFVFLLDEHFQKDRSLSS
jgi:hypothetical protein